MSGITDTPVSKPLSPSASLGKMMAEASARPVQSPAPVNCIRQLAINSGREAISIRHRPNTITLRRMYGIATTAANPIASLKPCRKTPASRAKSTSVIAI
jgi:hypothetical protein